MARQIFTHVRILAAVFVGAMALALAPVVSANDTVALKNALYAAGYDINNVSPQMDDTTRSALTAFQKDQGLNASGVLDDATKKALGMVHVQSRRLGRPATPERHRIQALPARPPSRKEKSRRSRRKRMI